MPRSTKDVRIFYEFNIFHRTYSGEYTHSEFLNNCFKYLRALYPFLPNELLVSRAKTMWKKALQSNLDKENEDESPLAKRVRLQQQNSRKNKRASTFRPFNISNSRAQKKPLDLFEFDTRSVGGQSPYMPSESTPFLPDTRGITERPKLRQLDLSPLSNSSSQNELGSPQFKMLPLSHSNERNKLFKKMKIPSDDEEISEDSNYNFLPPPISNVSLKQRPEMSNLTRQPLRDAKENIENEHFSSSSSPIQGGILNKRNTNFDTDSMSQQSSGEESSMRPTQMPHLKKSKDFTSFSYANDFGLKSSSGSSNESHLSSSDSDQQKTLSRVKSSLLSSIPSHSRYILSQNRTSNYSLLNEPIIQNLDDVSDIFDSDEEFVNSGQHSNFKSTTKSLISKDFIRLFTPEDNTTDAPNIISIDNNNVPVYFKNLTTTIEKVSSSNSTIDSTDSTIVHDSTSPKEEKIENLLSVKALVSKVPVRLDLNNNYAAGSPKEIIFFSDDDEKE